MRFWRRFRAADSHNSWINFWGALHPSAYYLMADHRIVHASMVRDIFLERTVIYSNYLMEEMELCLNAAKRIAEQK